MKLPEFKTVAGNLLPLPGVSINDERFYVQNSTEAECRDYVNTLILAGFCLYDKNELPAKRGYLPRINLAYTLTREDACVFLFWDASLHTTFVTGMPKALLPGVEKPRILPTDNFEPEFSQMHLTSGGMSYVARLRDGSYIIVDGGSRNKDDGRELYEFLCRGCRAGEKPKIAMWLFTHAHSDHIDLAADFIRDYGACVEIHSIAHQFPDCDKLNVACDMPHEKLGMEKLLAVISEFSQTSTLYYLHTGQRFYFKGATLEILSTMDNTFPSLYFSLNDTSVISRLTFDGGRSVMLLADSTHIISHRLADTYGDYLKSDILQLAHHGLIGGDLELYRLIDPDICLWPVKEQAFVGKLVARPQWCLGEADLDYNAWIRDESVKHREHYDLSRTVTFKV